MSRHVTTLDVLPTVADLVGARLPWRADGRTLVRRPYPEPARLRVHRVFGGVGIETTVEALERQRASVLADQLRLFGTGTAFPGRGGPRRREALLGRPVAEIGARSDGTPLVVADAEAYRDVQPGRGAVPAFVTGGAPELGSASGSRSRSR